VLGVAHWRGERNGNYRHGDTLCERKKRAVPTKSHLAILQPPLGVALPPPPRNFAVRLWLWIQPVAGTVINGSFQAIPDPAIIGGI
jgi:hypothetical protein